MREREGAMLWFQWKEEGGVRQSVLHVTCLRCEPLDFSMRIYLRGTWDEDEILVSEGTSFLTWSRKQNQLAASRMGSNQSFHGCVSAINRKW